MANYIQHLPHILNVQAGMNKWDPNHGSIYEVYFTLPEVLQSMFKEEELLLTEQVTKVSGLDVLQKTSAAGSQKFFGVDVSFLNPVMDTTVADLTITFNLNLRNVTDNYVLKVFRAWSRLGYDLSDGSRSLMAQYCTDNLRIAEANRDGTIWRSYIFHKVLLTGVTGLNDLDYTNADARTLDVTFRADYWDDDLDAAVGPVNAYHG